MRVECFRSLHQPYDGLPPSLQVPAGSAQSGRSGRVEEARGRIGAAVRSVGTRAEWLVLVDVFPNFGVFRMFRMFFFGIVECLGVSGIV